MRARTAEAVSKAVAAERERIAAKAAKWAEDLDLFKDKGPRDLFLAFAATILIEDRE